MDHPCVIILFLKEIHFFENVDLMEESKKKGLRWLLQQSQEALSPGEVEAVTERGLVEWI